MQSNGDFIMAEERRTGLPCKSLYNTILIFICPLPWNPSEMMEAKPLPPQYRADRSSSDAAGLYLLWVSARTLAILTENFRDFLQSLQANARTVP
jgi:glycopeptide antibiotics resistance protein